MTVRTREVQTLTRRSRSFGAAGIVALGAVGLWTGCSSKHVTEIVVGVETQMRVPEDLQTVRLIVNGGGVVVFDQQYSVYNGRVLLPQTLGLVPGTGQVSVTITVAGYTLASDNPYFDTMPPPGDEDTLILRRAVTQYVDSQIVYLPMGLRFPCYAVSCADGQTCVAGQCMDSQVASSSLPRYSDDYVFGNTSSCFDVANCFTEEAPPVVIDANACIFAPKGTTSAGDAGALSPVPPAVGTGVNVRVHYENLETEVLDLNDVEGFSVPDGAKPQEFQLSPGLCALYTGTAPKTNPHRIIAIGASAACPSKGVLQPICTGSTDDAGLSAQASAGPDSTVPTVSYSQLVPTTTALYLLMDGSSDMSGSFGPMGANQILSVTLKDPIIQNVRLAFGFFPANESCPPKFPDPIVPFEAPAAAQPMIATLFATPPASMAPLGADLALPAAYAALNTIMPASSVDRKAVAIISGNDLESDSCGKNGVLEAKPGVLNYYVHAAVSAPPGSISAAALQKIASAGFTVLDATTQAGAASAFNQIVAELGSCRYEMPATPLKPTDSLGYVDPLTLNTVQIPFVADCTTESGWVESQTATTTLVVVCGNACTTLKNAIESRAILAATSGTPAPNLPVYAEQVE